MPVLETEAGLDAAREIIRTRPGRPVVVADVWDNPGGGVAGDGTHVLRRILERGDMGAVALATIWDPIAVSFAHAAGETVCDGNDTSRRRRDRRLAFRL